MDTWEDSDPRLLPHVNHLIHLVTPRVREGGQIQCWSYALMVDALARIIRVFEEQGLSFRKEEWLLDPALEAYVRWREEQGPGTEIEAMVSEARRIGVSVVKRYGENEWWRYFTPFRE